MTSKPWTPTTSPLCWALAASAAILAALLLPQTPRALAVIPLMVTVYMIKALIDVDDDE